MKTVQEIGTRPVGRQCLFLWWHHVINKGSKSSQQVAHIVDRQTVICVIYKIVKCRGQVYEKFGWKCTVTIGELASGAVVCVLLIPDKPHKVTTALLPNFVFRVTDDEVWVVHESNSIRITGQLALLFRRYRCPIDRLDFSLTLLLLAKRFVGSSQTITVNVFWVKKLTFFLNMLFLCSFYRTWLSPSSILRHCISRLAIFLLHQRGRYEKPPICNSACLETINPH